MQPDQTSFLLNQILLPSVKNEQRITKGVIAAMPADKGDYRPDPNAKSAMELAWHIVSTEMRFMDAVAAGAFDFSPMPQPATIKNSADLVKFYDEAFEPRFQKLTTLSHEQLDKVVDFRGIFQLPAVTYINFLLH